MADLNLGEGIVMGIPPLERNAQSVPQVEQPPRVHHPNNQMESQAVQMLEPQDMDSKTQVRQDPTNMFFKLRKAILAV
jgi:hypothetical protein